MILSISVTQHNSSDKQLLEKKSIELQRLLHLDKSDTFEVNLILDEICSNIFEHNTDTDSISVKIEISGTRKILQMVFTDNGEPFDPTGIADPDTTQPLEKRQPGGLGLLLVKKYSDRISYNRLDDKNVTTVFKTLKQKT